jgi:hypothetical protein
MTGRGAGYCGGYDAPGYTNPVPRMGLGWRRGWGGAWGGGWGRPWGGAWGRGRGWRHMYYATGMPGWVRAGYGPAWGAPPTGFGPYDAMPTPEQETDYLRAQAEWLKQELDAITGRIEELEQAE